MYRMHSTCTECILGLCIHWYRSPVHTETYKMDLHMYKMEICSCTECIYKKTYKRDLRMWKETCERDVDVWGMRIQSPIYTYTYFIHISHILYTYFVFFYTYFIHTFFVYTESYKVDLCMCRI